MAGYLTIDFDVEKYSKNKKDIADTIGFTVLEQMMSFCKINGLPDTIPERWVKSQLFQGYCVITNVGLPGLYSFGTETGLGGEPDAYYQPTLAVISNPALNYSKTLKIGEECVLISNDVYRRGLVPLIGKYAGLLTENTISIRMAEILSRIPLLMSASDSSTYESALEFLKQTEDGTLGVISTKKFDPDDFHAEFATSGTDTKLTNLIEMEQYLKASLYNLLGLNANYNMKREAINSTEAQMGDDVLQPFIDQMKQCWTEGFDEVNQMFGTNITLEWGSAWADNEAERESEVEAMKGANDGNSDESDNSREVSGDGDSDKHEEEEDGKMADKSDGE